MTSRPAALRPLGLVVPGDFFAAGRGTVLAPGRWALSFGRTVLCAASVCALLVVGGSASVEAATVVLVRPPHPTDVAAEATVRLRGELVSAGFDVRVVDAPAAVDIRASLEAAAAAPDVEAVVAIFGEAAPDSAELWVIDRVTGKTVVRRVPSRSESARAAEVLSIRALELLRASFLEVALAASRSPPAVAAGPPPLEVTRWTRAALREADSASAPARPRFAAEVGGCVLGSLEGLPPAALPVVRAELAFGGRFLGRVTVAGLGTRARVDIPTGVAEIAQQLGLLEGIVLFRAGKAWRPFLSLGAGAVHVSAEGQAAFPYQGRDGDRWAAVADAGAGFRIPLGEHFAIAAELHAQLDEPNPLVRFLAADVARAGRPTLMGSLTVIAWM